MVIYTPSAFLDYDVAYNYRGCELVKYYLNNTYFMVEFNLCIYST